MHGLWMIITKCQKESLEFFKEALMTPRTLRQSSMDLVEKKKKSVLRFTSKFSLLDVVLKTELSILISEDEG